MAQNSDILGTIPHNFMNYSRRILTETEEKQVNYQGMYQKRVKNNDKLKGINISP